MLPAWEGCFKMVPDYAISHSEIFANGDILGPPGAHFQKTANSEVRLLAVTCGFACSREKR